MFPSMARPSRRFRRRSSKKTNLATRRYNPSQNNGTITASDDVTSTIIFTDLFFEAAIDVCSQGGEACQLNEVGFISSRTGEGQRWGTL